MTEITIALTDVSSICSGSISYRITSSNCSSVDCTTTRNAAICSNLPIATACAFNIRSEVCGQTETTNDVITVSLRRTYYFLIVYSYTIQILFVGPRVHLTPVYSSGSSSVLRRVMITIYPEVGVLHIVCHRIVCHALFIIYIAAIHQHSTHSYYYVQLLLF